jgi:DNA-directed RNA polymerase subunit beta'
VKVNDKHIEMIVRQMLRRVAIVEAGDTDHIVDEQVERLELLEENDRMEAAGKLPATYETCGWVLPRHRCRPIRLSRHCAW